MTICHSSDKRGKTMNVSEYYEYKKDNDKKIADYKEQQEKEKKASKKARSEKDKERIKGAVEKTVSVVSAIPHFTKAAGAAAILGLLGAGYNKVKGMFK